MKKKKKGKGKKKSFQWLFWICFVILCLMLFAQIKREREMVRCYNRGNRYYREGEFDRAQSEYWAALAAGRKLLLHRECDVRCNLALSIVTPLTPDSVTEENLDETLSKLLSAKFVLTGNECAHDFDNNGHDADCQTLKNEIDAYIEMLTPPEPEEEAEELKESTPEEKEEKDRETQVREELERIQKEGVTDRKDELNMADKYNHFEFYDGACW